MRLRTALLAFLALALAPTALAQVADDFQDGDFTANPAWSGEATDWSVEALPGGTLALRSDGPAASDTLSLYLDSEVTRGTWAFTFAYQNVNLSNSNNARVYLFTTAPPETGAFDGYFIQLGTNGDELILVRVDEDLDTGRTTIARADDVFPGTDGTVRVEVTRDEAGAWAISAGGTEVLTATDNTYQTGDTFGLWVKHTSANGQAFWFDDLAVSGQGGPTDTTPPVFANAVYAEMIVRAIFDEPLDPATVEASDFALTPQGGDARPPTDATIGPSGDSVHLTFGGLANGSYSLAVSGIADVAGNVLTGPASVPLVVDLDQTPPRLESAEPNDAGDIVTVRFDEPVNAAPACQPSAYSLAFGDSTIEPDGVDCGGGVTLTPFLTFTTPLAEGTYTLTATGISDDVGNVAAPQQTSFFFGSAGDTPEPGDLVVNEIMYAPEDPAGEYVEVYNASDMRIDLSTLVLADARLAFVPVSDAPTPIEPDGYATLVRDGDTFSTAFPGVPFVEVANWPALNNGGDSAVLGLRSDDGATVIDAVPYESSWGGSDGRSLERIDPFGSSTSASNFATSTAEDAAGTPGAINSVFALDTTPPTLLSATVAETGALVLAFSELLDNATVDESDFTLIGGTLDIDLIGITADTVALGLGTPLGTGDYTIEVRDIADPRGNVQAFTSASFSIFIADTPAVGDLVINEIMADPDGSGEYLEIFNTSDKTFDLADLGFSDANSSVFRVRADTAPFGPGEYVVLVQDGALFAAAFPGVAFVEPTNWASLNNGGDIPMLYRFDDDDPLGLDAVPYMSSWGGGDGVSLERLDPGASSESAANFASSTAPSGGTPGAQNSVFFIDTIPPILLSARYDSETTVITALFDEPITSVDVNTFTLSPPSTVVAEVAVRADTAFITLAAPLVTATYSLTATDVADVRGNTGTSSAAFDVFVADVPRAGDLIVNEIMADPDGSGEYIEIYNRSDKTVDASTLGFADSNAEVRLVGGAARPLGPDEYLVLVQNPVLFAEAFPGVSFTRVANWPALNNSGDTAALYYFDDDDPLVLDAVPYLSSWGGGDGVSLERLDPSASSESALNFASSTAPSGGTPGAQNSVFFIDTVPPALTGVYAFTSGDTVVARFSEPITTETAIPSAFVIQPGSIVPVATEAAGDSVVLALAAPLATGTYVLQVRDVADARGNVLTFGDASFSAFVPVAPTPRAVVLNEFIYAPADGGSEYIEVLNRSGDLLDLSQFGIADSRSGVKAVGGDRQPLAPGGYAILVQDSDAFAATFPGVAHTQVASWPTLNSGGDSIALYFLGTGEPILIDSLGYTPAWGGGAVALERLDPAGPSDTRFNWAESTNPIGSPGVQNTRFQVDETAPALLYAVQVTENTVEVGFDEPVTVQSFALGGTAPSTTVTDDNTFVLTFAGSVGSGTLRAEGVRDLKGIDGGTQTAELAVLPRAGDLVITEIMYDPLVDRNDDRPDQVEYVELLVQSNALLSLRGLFLTDRPDEDGEADTLRLTLPPGALPPTATPGSYVVIFAAPDDPEDPRTDSRLAKAFPQAVSQASALLPVDASNLGLGNSGDLIRLHDLDRSADGTPGDGPVFSEVEYAPSWHQPFLDETTGIALERLSPSGGDNDPANWDSSVSPLGGTPGAVNSRAFGETPEDAPGIIAEPRIFSPDGDGIDEVVRLRYTLEADAAVVRLRIYDQSGRFIRTLEGALLSGRSGEVAWDGRDGNGNPQRVGIYIALAEAISPDGGTTEGYKRAFVLARPLD